MSAAFCEENNLIYTGAHDGTLIGWSFETGYIKQYLHDLDPTCTCKDYIEQSKSVDQIIVLKQRKKLVSLTADQYLRVWSLDVLTTQK